RKMAGRYKNWREKQFVNLNATFALGEKLVRERDFGQDWLQGAQGLTLGMPPGIKLVLREPPARVAPVGRGRVWRQDERPGAILRAIPQRPVSAGSDEL